MNRRRGGLGSGLDALLPGEVQQGGMREIAIESIRQNPRQPRMRFDEEALDELAASIREHGIIQPLIVSERDNVYELVAGERRWRAAQRAGLEHIPVIVRETTPQQLLELALIENVQRADLNALEEAHAYQSLWEEFGLSDSQIAKRVGKNSRETIANTRRLLKLPAEVQEAVLKGQISAGHGRALLKFETEQQQRQALDAILSDELNVREVEQLGELTREHSGDIVRALATTRQRRAHRTDDGRRAPAQSHKSTTAGAPGISAEDQEIKREMERVLGTPVSLARSDKDLRVTITFHTEEKLQEFFDLLNAR
ncbi:MAG: ParB/RepB/Spo0J family partition protein [Roseiflexaceae bacterium]